MEPPPSRNRSSEAPLLPRLLARQRSLWVVAILFYGIGDTATTLIGFDTRYVAEAGPVVDGFVGQLGVGGLFAVKFLTFGVFYVAWRGLSSPGRVGLPLALATVGVFVTLWNAYVLLPPGLLG